MGVKTLKINNHAIRRYAERMLQIDLGEHDKIPPLLWRVCSKDIYNAVQNGRPLSWEESLPFTKRYTRLADRYAGDRHAMRRLIAQVPERLAEKYGSDTRYILDDLVVVQSKSGRIVTVIWASPQNLAALETIRECRNDPEPVISRKRLPRSASAIHFVVLDPRQKIPTHRVVAFIEQIGMLSSWLYVEPPYLRQYPLLRELNAASPANLNGMSDEDAEFFFSELVELSRDSKVVFFGGKKLVERGLGVALKTVNASLRPKSVQPGHVYRLALPAGSVSRHEI